MATQTKTEALLEAIERRLTEISERQHALAVEKSHLVEQITPLRLGVASPDLALALLKSKGIALRGLAAVWGADRRPPPQEVVLRAVGPQRPKVTPFPTGRSETA
jgi:hypothetical protein